MIPSGLSKKYFLQAASQIDRDGVPLERRSVHYDVVLNNKRYPPKYIFSLASLFAFGNEHPAGDFNVVVAKNYFLSRGFEVIDRRGEAEKNIVDEDDESNFPEGSKRFGQHRYLERDSGITKKAKAKRLAEMGKLECDVCDLDFAERYGERGHGFVEAHHTKPVSMLNGRETTKISEIALVCSNCHRMLHRGEKLISVEQLKKIINERTIT